jgi:ribosomal protein S18 acetylase RimI-like enzyme
MASDLIIRAIQSAEDGALKDVVQMFQSMYDEEANEDHIKLCEDGPEIWLKGVTKGLGKFGVILLAESGGKNIGFAHGSLRILPDYYGNIKVGFISHVYVLPAYRKMNAGKELVKELESWFASKNVHSVELDVLVTNKTGMAFWQSLGYHTELQRSRKMGNKL